MSPHLPSGPLQSSLPLSRRQFLGATAATAAIAIGTTGAGTLTARAADAPNPAAASAATPAEPESLVARLYDSFNDEQRKVVCFDWDYIDPKRGLLRTRIQNNWRITQPALIDAFYTGEQRAMVREIFEKMLNPDWVKKIDQQLQDDAGGYGKSQGIALFGQPGQGKFEFVITGRHLTLRCDGNSAEHVAFGGPIFHGHEGRGFYEKPDHPDNIFWPQALEANRLYQMLDGRHREQALVIKGMPNEAAIGLRGKGGPFQGVPVTEFAADQKAQLQKVLGMLVEPYRQSDRDEALACLKTQGGLDACSLAFYKEADLGDDGVWDNWRLEGPAFAWHFRGKPHVHIWVNVADDPSVKLNAFEDSVM